MKIAANKLTTLAAPGWTHSGKIDRDQYRREGHNATGKRTQRAMKKRIRRILDKFQGE